MDIIPLIIGLLSGAAGGNIAGSLLKSGMGTMGRSLTGIVGGGGLAAALAMLGGGDASAAAADTANAMSVGGIVKSLGGGLVGGGLLTTILGMVTGKK